MSDYKFCVKCGAKLLADSNFCTNCGAKCASSEPSPTSTAQPIIDKQIQDGLKFLDGVGVPRDLNKAMECFRVSANNGNPEGEFWLGIARLYQSIAILRHSHKLASTASVSSTVMPSSTPTVSATGDKIPSRLNNTSSNFSPTGNGPLNSGRSGSSFLGDVGKVAAGAAIGTLAGAAIENMLTDDHKEEPTQTAQADNTNNDNQNNDDHVDNNYPPEDNNDYQSDDYPPVDDNSSDYNDYGADDSGFDSYDDGGSDWGGDDGSFF